MEAACPERLGVAPGEPPDLALGLSFGSPLPPWEVLSPLHVGVMAHASHVHQIGARMAGCCPSSVIFGDIGCPTNMCEVTGSGAHSRIIFHIASAMMPGSFHQSDWCTSKANLALRGQSLKQSRRCRLQPMLQNAMFPSTLARGNSARSRPNAC